MSVIEEAVRVMVGRKVGEFGGAFDIGLEERVELFI